MYEYGARVVRVVDGDTTILDVDLGFYTYVRMSCRLAGTNSIEIDSPGGKEARDHLAGLLHIGDTVTVKSVKHDKFAGRFDGIVLAKTVNINDKMISDGYAIAWNGRGPRPTPPWPIVARRKSARSRKWKK